MDLSGVIFVALALVWAVVLIPKALKHHDEIAKTRAPSRVSESLRVLVPAQGPAGDDAPTRGSIPQPRPATPRSLQDTRRAAAKAAARRRRRILTGLLLAVVAVTVGSVLGYLLPWAPAIPVAVTAAYLVLCRVLVRREHAAYAASRQARPLQVVEAAGVADEAPLVEVHNEQGLAVVSDSEATSAHDFAEVRKVAGGTVWDPLPMTLPTYVNKPRAHRSIRTIDLGAPGVTSSGRGLDDAPMTAAEAADEATAARHRAVGS